MDDKTYEEMKTAYMMIKDALLDYTMPKKELCEMYNLEYRDAYPYLTGRLGSTLEYLERMMEEEWLKLKK